MKSFGKLFVRLFLVASLVFGTIVSLFGAGVFDGFGSGSGSEQTVSAAPAPAPAPAPHPCSRLMSGEQ